jgi:hypothetical protein
MEPEGSLPHSQVPAAIKSQLNPVHTTTSLFLKIIVTTAWSVLRLRMEELPPVWRVAVNILNKQWRTVDKGWSSSLGLGEVLTTPHRKNVSCYELQYAVI